MPHGLCIMALESLGCNDSHNYQAAVSLHFVLFCFLFACRFVTCPWLERHLKGLSTETTFRSKNVFGANRLILLGLSWLRIVAKKKLLLSHWNQKLSFALFAQQKKHLHVRHRSVLIQVCFFDSTELFSLYHCIRIQTIHFFRRGSYNFRTLSRGGGSGHFNPLPRVVST